MTATAEQQKTSGTDSKADPQQLLTIEMQRHAEAIAKENERYADVIAAIQETMRAETRDEARSLIEDDREETTEVLESHEPAAEQKRELTVEQKEELFATLQNRLSQEADHYERPEGIDFGEVKRALEANPVALWSLSRLEETGGTPDIVAVEGGTFVFADCSEESPAGRRNCVYDKAAEALARGTFNGNAADMAEEFGVEMWSPEFYRQMQTSGKFDRRTWSWLKTDAETRSTSGALCGHRAGDHVYVNRDGARSLGGDRAWRGLLRVQKVS